MIGIFLLKYSNLKKTGLSELSKLTLEKSNERKETNKLVFLKKPQLLNLKKIYVLGISKTIYGCRLFDKINPT